MARNNQDDRLTIRGTTQGFRTKFAYWARNVEGMPQWKFLNMLFDHWINLSGKDREKALKKFEKSDS